MKIRWRSVPRRSCPSCGCRRRLLLMQAAAVDGERRGCGLMVRCDLVDARADAVLTADTEPETTVVITYPAAALESEIECIRRCDCSAATATISRELAPQRQPLRGRRLRPGARTPRYPESLEAEQATAERERVGARSRVEAVHPLGRREVPSLGEILRFSRLRPHQRQQP